MLRSSPFLVDVARRVVEHHRAAPAAVVAASVDAGGGWSNAIGAWGRARPDTIFDLASVTKPVTALTAARLVRQRRLDWGTPLGAIVPAARGTPTEHVPIELLLAHRAGLAAHEPLYATRAQHAEQKDTAGPFDRGRAGDAQAPRALREGMLRDAALARRPECTGSVPAEGFAPIYSDLGYLLAGEALARVAGIELDELFAREVLQPLGLESQMSSPRRLKADLGADRFAGRVAPTEEVAWRGGVIEGVVHDENAWVFAGEGAAGHAGLFGTAEAVAALGRAVLDAVAGRLGWFLEPADIEPLVRPRPGGTLRAGFDSKSPGGSSAGDKFGPSTIGHLGFTGTSIWMDPDRRLVGVLLSNRVHPTRDSDAIRRARPDAYDLIFDWACRPDGV